MKHILYRSSRGMWSWLTATSGSCKQEEHIHSKNRQSAACCYTALRRDRDFDGAACTSVEARPASISSSRQAVAVCAAKLPSLAAKAEFTTRLKSAWVLPYVLVRTYQPFPGNVRNHSSPIFMIKPFLHFRTGWYGRIFLLDRFLTGDNTSDAFASER